MEKNYKIGPIQIVKITNSPSRQIDCIGLCLQWKYTSYHVVPANFTFRRTSKPFFQKIFPQIAIRLNYHTHSNGVWCWWNISLFGGAIKWGYYSPKEFAKGINSPFKAHEDDFNQSKTE